MTRRPLTGHRPTPCELPSCARAGRWATFYEGRWQLVCEYHFTLHHHTYLTDAIEYTGEPIESFISHPDLAASFHTITERNRARQTTYLNIQGRSEP